MLASTAYCSNRDSQSPHSAKFPQLSDSYQICMSCAILIVILPVVYIVAIIIAFYSHNIMLYSLVDTAPISIFAELASYPMQGN